MTEGYRGLRHGAAWIDLSARGRILARGRDCTRLLHNLTTNNVKALAPGQGCYAFLLNPQGRIQADLNLFCLPEHFLIDTEPELREKLRAHIRRYIIADQVELDDVSDATACLGVEGPEAPAVLAALGVAVPGRDFDHVSWKGRTLAAATATGQPGARIFCPSPEDARELIARLEAAGARPASAGDVRSLRIENGRPRYSEEIRDTSLPQETQQMHAVSFDKGCYLGQEIVERIRAQGRVKWLLTRVELGDAPLPEPGAKIAVLGNQAEVASGVVSPETGAVVVMAWVRTAPPTSS